MPTAFQHRILLVVPAAKVAAVVAWFQANVGAGSVPADLGPGLNPSGLAADPATHRWCSGSWVDADARAILAKLCQLAGVTPPAAGTWAGWTQAQKMAWLRSVQAAILSGYGAFVTLCSNTDVWDDPAAALAALGLKAAGGGG
jgi:hypothetical protein